MAASRRRLASPSQTCRASPNLPPRSAQSKNDPLLPRWRPCPWTTMCWPHNAGTRPHLPHPHPHTLALCDTPRDLLQGTLAFPVSLSPATYWLPPDKGVIHDAPLDCLLSSSRRRRRKEGEGRTRTRTTRTRMRMTRMRQDTKLMPHPHLTSSTPHLINTNHHYLIHLLHRPMANLTSFRHMGRGEGRNAQGKRGTDERQADD